MLQSTFVAILSSIQANPYRITFYVSTDGNDANSGLTQALAWRHHPWDTLATGVSDATVLLPGDRVILKGGDIFYGGYIVAPAYAVRGKPVTTTSISGWGSGLPVYSGAKDPATLSWSVDGGSYSCALTVQPQYVVYNTTKLTFHTGVGNAVGANEFDWAANVLYVNVGEDPSIGVLKASNMATCFNSSRNDIVVSNLILECSNSTTGGVFFNNGMANNVVQNCTIRYCIKHGIYQYNGIDNKIIGCTIHNITEYGIYHRAGATGGVVSGNTIYSTGSALYCYQSHYAEVRDNITYSNTTFGITISGCTAPTVCGNLSYSNGFGIYFNACTLVSVFTNTTHNNTTYGIGFESTTTGLCHHNYIYDEGTGYYPTSTGVAIAIVGAGASVGILIYQNYLLNNRNGVMVNSAGSSGCKFYYNLVVGCFVNSINLYADAGTAHIEVYNNVVIHDPSALNDPAYTGHGICLQSGAKNAKIANNIVVLNHNGANCNGICISGVYADVWVDYNIIYDNSGGGAALGKLGSTQYTSLATWQAAVQADAKVLGMDGVAAHAEVHTLNSNPTFTDLVNNLFTLVAGSPAINAGIAVVGPTVDYVGAAIGNPPEIGAYEF